MHMFRHPAWLLLCLLSLPLQAQDLPLFPSKSDIVPLRNTEGVELSAVIHDVWPERQSVRIFVEEKGDSFILPMDTFDEDSQTLIKDWYYKRLISERLNVKCERELMKSEDSNAPDSRFPRNSSSDGLPNAPYDARDVKIDHNVRQQRINTEMYNSAAFPMNDLELHYGLLVVRTISGAGKSDRETMHTSIIPSVTVPGRSTATPASEPVSLVTHRLRYETVTDGTDGYGRPVQYVNRTTIKTEDRVSAFYLLVYYKGELVAGMTTQGKLIDDSVKYLSKDDSNGPAKALPDRDTDRDLPNKLPFPY
ncbi:MAG: hypothetical protein Q7Q73_01175 [Verrucomicrobiota bacterium JB024]|nr:hypothetical protein [Verrucomicrobiota bacterium JB024]